MRSVAGRGFIFPCFLLFFQFASFAQDTLRFKVKRQFPLVLHRTDAGNDTIEKVAGARFILLMPDSLRDDVVLRVENGALVQQDSILFLRVMTGLRYESVVRATRGDTGVAGRRYKIKTLINGVSSQNGFVVIQVYHLMRGEALLERKFVIRSGR